MVVRLSRARECLGGVGKPGCLLVVGLFGGRVDVERMAVSEGVARPRINIVQQLAMIDSYIDKIGDLLLADGEG